jgi:hypothetical protein
MTMDIYIYRYIFIYINIYNNTFTSIDMDGSCID